MKQQPKPEASDPEHTIFVDGTWQPGEGEDPYWSQDVQDAGQDVLGQGSRETFSWYGGPNDARARRMAGRKLYQDAVLPGLKRGQRLNFVAHSHGGNVVGEMGAYADERAAHVEQMGEAARSGSKVDRLKATGSIGRELFDLGGEALSLGTPLETGETSRMSDAGKEQARREMLAQLAEEGRGLLGDGMAVWSGDESRFAEERDALAGARMGDAVFANTPWLSKHKNPLDSKLLAGSDHMYSFRHEDDIVANVGQEQAGDKGRRLSTGHEGTAGPTVVEAAWERDLGIQASWEPSLRHSTPVNDPKAFKEEFGSVIDPNRFSPEAPKGPAETPE